MAGWHTPQQADKGRGDTFFGSRKVMDEDKVDKVFSVLAILLLLLYLAFFGVVVWAIIEVVQWLTSK